jgi:hypothetical protein
MIKNLESEFLKDTTLKISIQKQDSIITLLNGIAKINKSYSPLLKNRLDLQIRNQEAIIKNLTLIEGKFDLRKDTLNTTIKTGLKEITNKIPETGSRFWDILGSAIGAILSGAFAIAIFVQGRRNDKKKENKKVFEYGEEIFTLIKNIVVNSKEQVKLLDTLIQSIREKPHTHGSYKHINFNLLKRAQSFDTTRVFNTFQYLNLEKKSYIKFYSSVDFLLEEFVNVDNDYHENNSKVITPFSNDFIKLRQKIFTQGTDYIEQKRRESKTDDPLYVFLNDLIIQYYTSPDLPSVVDIKYDFDSLIRPLKVELVEKFRDYDQANDILSLAKEAGDIYTSIIGINNDLGNNIEGQMSTVNKMIIQLEQIETELKIKYAS